MDDFTPYILPAGAVLFAIAIVVMAKVSRKSVESRLVATAQNMPSQVEEPPHDEAMEQARKLSAEFQALQDALSAVGNSIEQAVREVASAGSSAEREKVNH